MRVEGPILCKTLLKALCKHSDMLSFLHNVIESFFLASFGSTASCFGFANQILALSRVVALRKLVHFPK